MQAETAEIGDGHVTLVSDSDQLIPVYVDEEAEGAEGTVEQAMADFSVGGTIAGLVNDSGITTSSRLSVERYIDKAMFV